MPRITSGPSRRTVCHSRSGYTLAELLMVCSIIIILAAMVVPVAKFSIQREKEIELRYSLRQMRTAIDDYKKLYDQFHFQVELGSDGYPSEMEDLVKGVDINGKYYRFLRRVPVDPMTGEAEWGMRSTEDEPDSDSWGGNNVYDVYSLSTARALDGSHYNEW